MYGNTSFSNFWPYGHHLHWIFIGLFVIGLIFLAYWGIKHLDKKQLQNWTIGLLLVGGLGMLLTSTFGTFFCPIHGSASQQTFMEHMLDDDHSPFSTPSDMRDHMPEEMGEYIK